MLVVARLASVAAAVLTAAFIGGCSVDNGAANRYVKSVDAAQKKFADTIDQAAASITPKSTPLQDQATLKRFQKAIDVVVADLRTIKPPAKVSGDHTRLVAAMTIFDGQVSKALSKRSGLTLEQAQEKIRRATVTVNKAIGAAIDAINSKLGK